MRCAGSPAAADQPAADQPLGAPVPCWQILPWMSENHAPLLSAPPPLRQLELCCKCAHLSVVAGSGGRNVLCALRC
eukprot:m.31558 g.31558  ORF g.31558 m.31558 type:complete len:76 (-) comp5373_c1_seq1:79-306(-)